MLIFGEANDTLLKSGPHSTLSVPQASSLREKGQVGGILICCYQRQKSVAVKKVKFRGTAKCRNAEFRGSFAVKICNFVVISR